MTTNERPEEQPLLWIPGQGFGGKKKLAIKTSRLIGVKPSDNGVAAPISPEEVQQNITLFLKMNHVLLGFIAWNGYFVDSLGSGVVYCDALDSGIEAETIGVQYVPSETILAVLRQQDVDEAAVKAMEQQLDGYIPNEVIFVVLALHGRIFPVALHEPSLPPPECYRLVQSLHEPPEAESEGDITNA